MSQKAVEKQKVDKSGAWEFQLGALINTDYKYLRVLQSSSAMGVDEKGNFYWSCMLDELIEGENGYDVVAWYISIYSFLEQKYESKFSDRE